MKNNLSSLLRKIFLSSLAGIVSSNIKAANETIIESSFNEGENAIVTSFKGVVDLTPKLILKKNRSNELFTMAHRSHRSHSSHRSHYSSSSGGSYQPTTNSSSSRGSYQPSSTSGLYKSSNNSNVSSNVVNISRVLKLGSRTLKKGMSGTDVTELVNILLTKKYLKLDSGGTQVTGIYLYDEIIEGAVKDFQADHGITPDGVCGSTCIYYLKNQ